jgi:hypothetical protein
VSANGLQINRVLAEYCPQFVIRPGHTQDNHAFSLSLIRFDRQWSTIISVVTSVDGARKYQIVGDEVLYDDINVLLQSALGRLKWADEVTLLTESHRDWDRYASLHQDDDSGRSELVLLKKFFELSDEVLPTQEHYLNTKRIEQLLGEPNGYIELETLRTLAFLI